MQTVIDRPSKSTYVQQIVQSLDSLPPEQVAEVWDFVSFLHYRHIESQTVDENDSWSEQDLRDLSLVISERDETGV